ncbi:hypothetical protein ES702_04079 [subsurface metagenome]
MKTDTSLWKAFRGFLSKARVEGMKKFDDATVSVYIEKSEARGYTNPGDDEDVLQVLQKFLKRHKGAERVRV